MQVTAAQADQYAERADKYFELLDEEHKRKYESWHDGYYSEYCASIENTIREMNQEGLPTVG